MVKSAYKKIAEGEMKGWVSETLIDFLPPHFFQEPVHSVEEIGGRVVAESKWRWAGLFSLTEEKKVFLKRDKTKGWLEFLKYLIFPSKGRKEWFIAYQLGKRNLNVPRPLGWMERVHRGLVEESYYLSEAIPSGVSLAEIAEIMKDEKISTELVKMVVRMHSSGLLHQDLHAGNFLWDGESFFLVDLHRARLLRSLSLDQRLWNFAHLFHSLRSIWGEGDQSKFLKAYVDGSSVHVEKPEECLKKIHSWMDRLQRRQWDSRTRRCLKESTEFSVRKTNGMIAYHRKNFPFDRLERVIANHFFLLKENPSGLKKQSQEIVVSLFEDGGDQVCVKQFCYSKFSDRLKEHFRHSKGLKAWLGGNGLRVRGVSSVKPLALMEKKRRVGRTESFLIMEASHAEEEMDCYLCRGFDGMKEKRDFIKAFACWLTALHQKRIYHQDMKACNILISKNQQGWGFKLLDLEDVRLNKKVDEKKLFRNLLQLNTSIPHLVTRTDRLRFFRAYLKQHPILRSEKEFLFRLIQKSKERGVAYVSPYGVIKENL